MKKFVFPLERMLAFKRSLYEKERNELARLRAKRHEIEQKRDETEQQMLQLDEEFRRKAASTGVKREEISKQNFHRDNADKLIKQLEQEMADMDVLIEKQLRVVIQLDQDVKGLEKLREKQLDEYNMAAAKEEQERISELVSTKFIEGQRASNDG